MDPIQDITSEIVFTNPQLATATEVINQFTDILFKYTRYTFSINWSVDFVKLLERGIALNQGDYFTFHVPLEFRNLSFNLTNGGVVWANVVIDGEGQGAVTFTSAVEGLTSVSGTLNISYLFTEVVARRPVMWEFIFGDTITAYSGTSEGRTYNNTHTVVDNRKTGSHSSLDLTSYFWDVYANINQHPLTGVATITDSLGDFHRVRHYTGSPLPARYGYYSDSNYGVANYYGVGDMSYYYFAVSVVDWNTMRDDYNAIIDYNLAQGFTTVHYLDKNGNDVDSYYQMASKITDGTSSFMREVMISWTNLSNGYIYVQPYTGGFDQVEVDDDGFRLVFPLDALDQKSYVIRLYTQITSPITPSILRNNVTVAVEDYRYDFTAAATIAGSGEIFGELGSIHLYKFDSGGRTPLSDVTFSFNIEGQTLIEPMTTDDNGHLLFNLVSNGVSGYAGDYLLSEITIPDHYQPLPPITVSIEETGLIVKVNDTAILPDQVDGTTVYDLGRKICWISTDQLAIVVYNYRFPSIDVQLEGHKVLSGRSLNSGEFVFLVKELDGNLVATGVNDRNGRISFSPLTFTVAGEYHFLVSERNSANKGIDYDDTVYPVLVNVSPDGEEDFTAVIDYPATGLVFRNTYTPGDDPTPHCRPRVCRHRRCSRRR